MRVLVACEWSGAVRDAFRARGHEAWSCDLEKSEDSAHHIKGNVLQYLEADWDMMIAFPPCTHLAVSGARYFKEKQADGRQQDAVALFLMLTHAPAPRIAIENPIGIMSTKYRKPDQIIQPWQFGHPESKATCLWLKNLPLLVPTNILPKRTTWENQTSSGQNRLGPSPERAKLRGQTYLGIAEAMADQWGSL